MGGNRFRRAMAWFVASFAIAVIGVGCPYFGADRVPSGTAKVTTVLTADASPVKTVIEHALNKQGGGPLALDEIESLVVTVEKVELLREEEDDEEETDSETETGDDSKGVEEGDDDEMEETEGDDDGGPVEVYTGSMDVDLINLVGVSEILSSVEVPAGDYKRIVLSISNPRLILASDTETVITDVMLTANGRVFVNGDFTVEDGESRILQIDLGGIHLVQTGNGKFVLTPQLQADISSVQLEDVIAVGDVVAVDPDADTFDIMLEDGVSTVFYGNATIYLPGEQDPTGTENDLVVGAVVDVEGTLQIDGSITAAVIRILATP